MLKVRSAKRLIFTNFLGKLHLPKHFFDLFKFSRPSLIFHFLLSTCVIRSSCYFFLQSQKSPFMLKDKWIKNGLGIFLTKAFCTA